VRVSPTLASALLTHRQRLQNGGAQRWAMFDQVAGTLVEQAQLASLLEAVASKGRDSFYSGASAVSLARAVQALGGTLSEADLHAHVTVVSHPIETNWGTLRLAMQPPMTQGVLLNMAVQALARLREFPATLHDHVAIELTEAAFAFRSEVARGEALLAHELSIDFERASRRGGPRAYLHTAGVATADAEGNVVSSLVSVFDDFGSCVFVPELGITLNNRAGGFTSGANSAAPGKRPVHTLAPALLVTEQGALGMATPGADGQVQTLLQVLIAIRREGIDLAQAIARPRWRSENDKLLIERSHSRIAELRALGHQVEILPDGAMRFGAVVCAGHLNDEPIACADWRRETAAGVA
jgi:gamma-glutamyltranspeptidase/glutathione hydrolase